VENPLFANGTKAIFEATVQAPTSIVGGGDTLNCIADVSKITHLSTGGGAMLEYIEKQGKLPAIDFLNTK
jgi:phosphoglycerate kinase